MRTRRYARIAALALALLAAAWFLPPVLSAERYRHRVASRLQQALGRPVQFGHISLKFIPRPGFSIDNVSVLEDPQFGAEPFARVDHIDCDLALVSLLRGQAALESLSLEGAAINLVRDSPGRWNVERFVAGAAHALPGSGGGLSGLSIEVSDARLNFKFGVDKKPFAVTDLHGRVDLDRKRRLLNFDLTGSPVRTDIRTGLGMPSPGQIELQGFWKPGQGGEDAVNATLRARGALLYDWIPLLAGRNPEIYGLVDADAHLTGSPSLLNVEAQFRLSQLRRWESLPAAVDLPVSISLKGQLDRLAGQANIGDLEASFGDSRLSLKGSMLQLGANPLLNLTAATDQSRLENFITLVGRLAGQPSWWDPRLPFRLTGTLDGAVSIQGEWPHISYSGLANSRSSRLVVGNSAMPVSDAVVRFEGRHFELLPVRISATPNLTVVAEGALNLPALTKSELTPDRVRQAAHKRLRPEGPQEPGYRLSFLARPSPAHEIVTLAAAIGFGPARSIDARGLVTANLTLAGTLRPLVHPSLTGVAEVRAAEIVLPGLIKPIQISRAHIGIDNEHITIDPLTASFAAAVFTGRVEHSGARTEPWTFDVRSPALDLAEAPSWFEALGHLTATPWFELIPGLSTLAARRAAGASLFNALTVQGELSTSTLTYRRVTLRNVRARVEMSKRLLRVTSAEFGISGGRGLASAEADLNGPQPRLATNFAVSGLRLENWASHLPPQLAEARGTAAFSGRLSAEGASFPALEATLQGHARLTVTNVDLGHYDPLRDTVRAAAWGELSPVRNTLTLHSGEISLDVRDRRLIVKPTRFELAGAVFEITGSCGFDGKAQFVSSADLQNASRRWTDENDPNVARTAHFLLSGALDALKATNAGPTAPTPP